jgi:hypothetical protein
MRGKQAPPAKDEIRQGNQPLDEYRANGWHDGSLVYAVGGNEALNCPSDPSDSAPNGKALLARLSCDLLKRQ